MITGAGWWCLTRGDEELDTGLGRKLRGLLQVLVTAYEPPIRYAFHVVAGPV